MRRIRKRCPRTKALFPQVHYHEDAYQALQDADCRAGCTEWDTFENSIGTAPKSHGAQTVIDEEPLYGRRHAGEGLRVLLLRRGVVFAFDRLNCWISISSL